MSTDAQTPRPVRPSVTCPKCGLTVRNPNHIRTGYCRGCDDFTMDPKVEEPPAA